MVQDQLDHSNCPTIPDDASGGLTRLEMMSTTAMDVAAAVGAGEWAGEGAALLFYPSAGVNLGFAPYVRRIVFLSARR